MSLMQKVQEFLGGRKPAAPDVRSTDIEAPGIVPPWPRHDSHGRDRYEGARPRRRAETELALALAKCPKAGYYKVTTSEGEKVVFNFWVSPHEDHVDRKGNRVKRLYVRSLYRNGEKVASVPFRRGEQGPYLPVSMLYGFPVDPERFPEEYREVLEEFADPLMRGIKEYKEAYRARRKAARRR